MGRGRHEGEGKGTQWGRGRRRVIRNEELPEGSKHRRERWRGNANGGDEKYNKDE